MTDINFFINIKAQCQGNNLITALNYFLLTISFLALLFVSPS